MPQSHTSQEGGRGPRVLHMSAVRTRKRYNRFSRRNAASHTDWIYSLSIHRPLFIGNLRRVAPPCQFNSYLPRDSRRTRSDQARCFAHATANTNSSTRSPLKFLTMLFQSTVTSPNGDLLRASFRSARSRHG
ncbi:hypothetical protein MRX96_031669 [Rhipicephalus microplus]